MTYAIITVGGKQYRVREGERLLVDRLPYDEGKTFQPDVLLVGGDGDVRVAGDLKGEQVTARVAAHVLGEKVVVGKHKRRTGYRRRNGHRSRLSQIEVESIGTRGKTPSSTPQKSKARPPATAKAKKTEPPKKTESAKKAEPGAKRGSATKREKKANETA
jgi:large subunit ribosomal protein L21